MALKINHYWLYLVLVFMAGCAGGKQISGDNGQAGGKVDTVFVTPESSEPEYPYRPSSTRKHDLIHTQLDVRFDMAKHYLHGTATLELTPYFYPQDSLILDAKGMEIHEVMFVESASKQSLQYQYDNKHLKIQLPKTFTSSEQYFVEIDYTAKPEEWTPEIENGGHGMYFIDYSFDDSLDFRKNRPFQVWTQGETEDNSCWFPTIDAPNERTTQEMYITVDSTFKTLSNGKLIYSRMNNDSTRTDYWKMEKPHAPYLFTLVVGDYAVVEDEWEAIPVNYYVEPDYAPYAKDIFGNTPEMLSFFSDTLNYDYPWAKYSQIVVRDFVAGAMENTTASIFMEDLQMDRRELIDKNWDGIIAHELIHHWFGNLVTCESWANLPLNEAFATYGEYLWEEYKYGEDRAEYILFENGKKYFDEAKRKKVNLIRFHYENREQMFDRHTYEKGGRVLHMLRNYVGDKAFFRALQYYLKQNAYSSVEIHDLRQAFEQVTGEDLNWFFNQWFLESGHPELKVTQQYDSGELRVKVEQLQDTKTTPVYRLPVAIDVWYGNGKERFNVVIDEQSEEFSFPVAGKPDLVLFDGDQDLLARVEHNKSDTALNFQYRHANQLIPRLKVINTFTTDSLVNRHRALLFKALDDDFWRIRRKAISSFDDYQGPDRERVINRLKTIAQNDEHSLVRAGAISTLRNMNASGLQELLANTLNDSSYAVLGASLEAYIGTNSSGKKEMIARYDTLNNFNVVIPIADYYATNNVAGKREWFREKLHNAGEEVIYYLLNYFGQYLQQQTNVTSVDVNILKNFAIYYPQQYVRLSAYRSLGLLTNYPDIEEVREEVRKKEQDPDLNHVYDSVP